MNYSIYWRNSDNRWVGKCKLPADPLTGEEKTKYIYDSTPGRKGKQEVTRKCELLKEQVEAGDLSQIYKMTVEGWLKKYLNVYCAKLEETTKDGYEIYINKHIIPIIGHVKLCDLKPIHIENFYNIERSPIKGKDKNGNEIIGKAYSEKTILQEHRILHRAFKKAVGDGMLSKNPCDTIDSPSPENYEPTIYSEQDFLLLLDKLEGHRMEAFILIAGMCGLRRGELLGLTWEAIDLENGIIKVHKNKVATKNGSKNKKPKTKKSYREFTIPSAIIPSLKRLRGIGSIFTRLDGEEYHPGSVSKIFSEFLKSNNLKHIRLHDLRHFNCTMMLKHGVSEREAMERSGHSNATMIKKYQHILKEMDKASADKLNNVFGVNSGVKAEKKTLEKSPKVLVPKVGLEPT